MEITMYELLKPVEAAEYLGLKPTTLAKWRVTKEQDLNYVKRGNRVLYRETDLEDFKERYEVYVGVEPAAG
jgi:excisionase family DNA binding protein